MNGGVARRRAGAGPNPVHGGSNPSGRPSHKLGSRSHGAGSTPAETRPASCDHAGKEQCPWGQRAARGRAPATVTAPLSPTSPCFVRVPWTGSRGMAATRRQLAVGPAVRVSHCPQEARRPLAPWLSLVPPPARGDRLGGPAPNAAVRMWQTARDHLVISSPTPEPSGQPVGGSRTGPGLPSSSLTSIGLRLLSVVRSPERPGTPRDPLPRREPHTPSERSGAAGSDPDLNWVPGTGDQPVHGGRPAWEPRALATTAHWSSGTDGGLSSRGRGFDSRMRYWLVTALRREGHDRPRGQLR